MKVNKVGNIFCKRRMIFQRQKTIGYKIADELPSRRKKSLRALNQISIERDISETF